MTNTPLRGQIADALNGREPLSTEDEEKFQSWARRQPWFLDHQRRTGFEPDLRTLEFNPRDEWQLSQRPLPHVASTANSTPLVRVSASGASPDMLSATRATMADYDRLGVQYSQESRRDGGVTGKDQYSDCSGMVEDAFRKQGVRFPHRLTTKSIDGALSPWFEPVTEPRPGDVMVERRGGEGHMGVFEGFRNGNPWGLQMGVTRRQSLRWGPHGEFATRYGGNTEYFRLRRERPPEH
jgi:hypothetical protein